MIERIDDGRPGPEEAWALVPKSEEEQREAEKAFDAALAEIPNMPFDDVPEGEVSELAGGRMRLPSELQAMRMSYARAKETLGWEPQVTLREGLEREWKWLQENPHRWNEMSY